MKDLSHPMHIDSVNIVSGTPGKYSTITNHAYHVRPSNHPDAIQVIQFQDGPINEDHIDGVHNEDLLLIVLDRLAGFQASEYSCRENAIAITKIEEALMWLCKRTQERRQRQVEGTNEK